MKSVYFRNSAARRIASIKGDKAHNYEDVKKEALKELEKQARQGHFDNALKKVFGSKFKSSKKKEDWIKVR